MQNATAEVGEGPENYKAGCPECLTSGVCSGRCVSGVGGQPKVFHQGGQVTEIFGGKIVADSIRAAYIPVGSIPVSKLGFAGYVIRHPDRPAGSPRYVIVENSAAFLVDKTEAAIQFVRERDARAYAAKHLDTEIDWAFDPL